MELLFVNACIRGEASRTLRLAKTVMQELSRLTPELHITELNLSQTELPCYTADLLAKRERLCDARCWENPIFEHVLPFIRCDAILIAAPYWDLSFPSVLKVWVENMYVRNLTFHYEDDRCIGHCRAKAALYITTSGSPIGADDWGTDYIRAVLKALGIPVTLKLSAEGLDLIQNNSEAILKEAETKALPLAEELMSYLS